MIEVSSGSLKGLKLDFKKSKGLRPTKSIVRQALFNIMGDFLLGSKGLDLFSGTGLIGFEAISRGADSVYFIERDYDRFLEIKSVIKSLPSKKKTYLYHGDALKSIDWFERNGVLFDWIYIDPPYGDNILDECVEKIINGSVLVHGGFMIIESDDRYVLSNDQAIVLKQKKYGHTWLMIYSINGY